MNPIKKIDTHTHWHTLAYCSTEKGEGVVRNLLNFNRENVFSGISGITVISKKFIPPC
jgi:hypothetical protein